MNKNSHGLGLSICKRIVECMGGTLEVTSDVGYGTTFSISLRSELYNQKKEIMNVSKANLIDCCS
jgi:signal transduction histidine kinase